jgi:hypothetical protein
MKILDLISYSVILAVLITTGYTLLMIYFYGSVQVLEPNVLILINEIFLVVLGTSFTIYKLKETLFK